MARRRVPSSAERWRTVGIAALASLAVVTVALIWVAQQRTERVPVDATAIPIPDFSPTASPTPAEPLVLPELQRLLVPAGDDVAWRTSSLACAPGGEAVLELTVDRGATWTPHPLGEVEAAAILAIEPIDSDVTVAVRSLAAADCSIGREISFTGGDFWRHEPDAVDDLAYAVPGASRLVHGADEFAIGCPTPSGFAVRTRSEAAVLCPDAVLLTTADAAVTWQPADLGAAVLAVAPVDLGYLVAEARHPDCAGVRLVVLRASDAGQQPLACLAAFDESTPVALAADGDDVWAWVGDEVAVSDDGGVSWPAAWLAAPDPTPTPTPQSE